jgi:hypothetical protein
MAAVSGVGTTYNLPNYHGELFTVSPVDTPFLSAIGGINGAKTVHSKTWEWQTIDRRSSSANNAALEGQAAPSGTARSRANVSNITEIHHSAIEVSYSKLAATGQYAGQNVSAEWDDAVIDEIQLQTQAELQSMGVDIEQSFLNGTLHVPADNTTARATQGILGAIATSVVAAGGAVTTAMVDALLQDMYGAGAPLMQESTVFLGNAQTAQALSDVYAASSQLSAPTRDRTVGGMAIKTITTLYGDFGVMMDRHMPAGVLALVDLAACYPVFTEIPQKGVLFVEPLAKTGATEKYQLYGEIGLEYGPETYHGKITGITFS